MFLGGKLRSGSVECVCFSTTVIIVKIRHAFVSQRNAKFRCDIEVGVILKLVVFLEWYSFLRA